MNRKILPPRIDALEQNSGPQASAITFTEPMELASRLESGACARRRSAYRWR